LLRFHGNTELIYIAYGYIYAYNNYKRNHCCVSMATQNIFIFSTATYTPTTITSQIAVAFPWQHRTYLYCLRLHISLQQLQAKLLLRFHGNTEHIYIVYGYIYAYNNYKPNCCCVSMATQNIFILFTATYTPTTITSQITVAFPWQQLTHDRPPV